VPLLCLRRHNHLYMSPAMASPSAPTRPDDVVKALASALPIPSLDVGITNVAVHGLSRATTRNLTIGNEPVAVALIAHGIGSARVVDWCTAKVLTLFLEAAGGDPGAESLQAAGQRAFCKAHQEACKIAAGTRSGCMLTLVAVNRLRGEVTTCNVGSAGVALFARGVTTMLAEDHTLDRNEAEQMRLRQLGVTLQRDKDEFGTSNGVLRALPTPNARHGISCARAIGSLLVSPRDDRGLNIVSPVPSCTTVLVPARGGDVLICSDGVWTELMVYSIGALTRAAPSAAIAARGVVEAAASQRIPYSQEECGVPCQDTACIVLRLGPLTAKWRTHGRAEGRLSSLMRASLSLFTRKAAPKPGANGRPGKATPIVTNSSTPGTESPCSCRSPPRSPRGGDGSGSGERRSLGAAASVPEDVEVAGVLSRAKLHELEEQRHRPQQPSPATAPQDQVEQQKQPPQPPQPPPTGLSRLAGSFADYRLAGFGELQVAQQVGEGGTATLWRAEWRGKTVCLKVLHEHHQACFDQEVAIWRRLSHPNVCGLLDVLAPEGVGRPCMVLEYMAGGSLDQLLHQAGDRKDEPLDAMLLARIISEVACGLAYMHRSGVIHRDVKAGNVLLDDECHAKLTDFGLAISSGRAEYTAETGTYRYMSPEVILHKPYDCKCDVYSFGIMMWEVLHQALPFPDLGSVQAAFATAINGQRPPISLAGELAPYESLLTCCWDESPSNRPEMDKVVQLAAQCQSAVEAHRCEYPYDGSSR